MSTAKSTPWPEGENDPSQGNERKTVLVVDDDASICEMITRHLKGLGYRTLTASDVRKAQEVILTHGRECIDLLLVELNLPRVRGDNLAKWFLRGNMQGQVLMMSSYLDHINPDNGVALLRKPFSLHDLRALIGKLLANSCTRQQAAFRCDEA